MLSAVFFLILVAGIAAMVWFMYTLIESAIHDYKVASRPRSLRDYRRPE